MTLAMVDLSGAARLVVETHAAAPCAVVSGSRWTSDGWRRGYGSAGRLWSPETGITEPPPEVTETTVFDLASLTKVVTALVMARLERENTLSRLCQISEFVPEVRGLAAADATLDVLLSHRAGLEAHIEFFTKKAGAEQPNQVQVIRRAASARRSECRGAIPEGGFDAVYSDLGYILVGIALERASGCPLDELVDVQVAQPLRLRLGSVRRLLAKDAELVFAPTEIVDWRGGMLQGVVHDENAWVLADRGSAGHAGLFGDALSVLALCEGMLDALEGRKADWLDAEDLEAMLRPRPARGPGGTYLSGVERRSGQGASSGQFFGANTFGHLGFTGTSLWIDPDAALSGVVLSNRVHPTRDHLAIRKARPAAYDEIHNNLM